MAIDKYLDKLDDMLEETWALPLTGGKRMIDIDKVRDVIDDIRMHLPQEIKEAKAIVSDREQIIRDAKLEAEDIIKRAENRARALVAEEEIVKTAKSRANEMINDSYLKSKEMERAALDFAENSLKKSEDVLLLNLNEVKSARMALRSQSKNTAAGKNQPGPARKQ
ncbi:MAG: ATPase [Oscillospiraceae bacterium]|nr:ATPase [Oscillospiraceae bacterium]